MAGVAGAGVLGAALGLWARPSDVEHELTAQLPMLRAEPPATAGKRRAVKHSGRRGPLFKALPSAPVLVGIAALAVSIGGAVTVSDPGVTSSSGNSALPVTHAASALSGSSGQGKITTRSSQVNGALQSASR